MTSASGPSLRHWAGFLAMCLGMFMAILDIQVVITSLHRIDEALDIGADRVSWVQTAYLIAEIIAIPLSGFLTRALSLRICFAAAITLFLAASLGCALSWSYGMLIIFRAIQGFAGGLLIPLVFSSVFLLFPGKGQLTATSLAGLFAVLAPTLGPLVGGWLTENYSWHWLFLINLFAGPIALFFGLAYLPREPTSLKNLRALDLVGTALMAISLAAFQIAMKEAPGLGWDALPVVLVIGCSLVSGIAFIRYSLAQPEPQVRLRLFADPAFTSASILSFGLGLVLYGSVYLLPLFLATVRQLGPLEIGQFMLVAGAAQLALTPLAVWLERRRDARFLTLCGFLLFGLGLYLNGHSTEETGFNELILPQIIRGGVVMLCILPATRMAMGGLPSPLIADGSSLFNLMRNLGGAAGIALVDTMIFTRAPAAADAVVEKLRAGDPDMVAKFEVTPEDLAEGADPMVLMGVMSDIERYSVVVAVNETWLVLAVLSALTTLALLLPPRRGAGS